MKNTLNRICLLTLACILMLTTVAFAEEADPAIQLAETIAADVDFTQYPEDFAEWDIPYLKIYLREVGLLENSGWVFDVTSGDLTAMNATAGTMYIDVEAGSVLDMIFFFDAKDESQAAVLNDIRQTQAIGEGEFATPMDAMLGGFCFSYTLGMDEDHMTALRAAIYALANHYDITPDFIYQ